MRKIIVSEFVSLDGVFENPAWTMPYWNDEVNAFKEEEDAITDALLLGRVTYDGFAMAWPQSQDPGAERMNSMRKYVVSNTLDNPTWNNTHVIKGDIVEQIKQIKQGDGMGLLVYGSGLLVRTLMEHNLVDGYRLLVYPLVLGTGKRFFSEGASATLRPTYVKTLAGGVVAMVYEPVKPEKS
jgi:dihydrofolate reductase